MNVCRDTLGWSRTWDNFELCIKNKKLCIKNTQKRGILYQNHTKTRNLVLNLMNFAGLLNGTRASWASLCSSKVSAATSLIYQSRGMYISLLV